MRIVAAVGPVVRSSLLVAVAVTGAASHIGLNLRPDHGTTEVGFGLHSRRSFVAENEIVFVGFTGDGDLRFAISRDAPPVGVFRTAIACLDAVRPRLVLDVSLE